MCVSTLRLLYHVSDAPTKEVVKEYFRLVGCLFCDEPIRSVQEAENALRKNDTAEVDIVLNLNVFNWEDRLSQMESSDIHMARMLWKERKSRMFLVNGKPPKEENLPGGEKGEAHAKRDFYRKLIEQLVDRIWDDEPQDQKGQLLRINDLYFDRNLFGFLQCKRALYVVNMGETLEILLQPQKISPDKYIGNMLLAFNQFYYALDDNEIKTETDEAVSVYVRYARVNVARKIREIFSMLEEVPVLSKGEGDQLPSVTYFHTEFLLNELGKLYRQDPKYPGTLFLAAHVCQSEPAQELDAAFYYQQLFEQIAKKTGKCYSFLYYEYGRYIEKVKKDWDLAVFYYTKAKDLDPLSYRAILLMCDKEVVEV